MQLIFYLIITILVLDFVLNRLLSILDVQYSKRPLPTVLSDIYDAQKYARQQEYFRTNVKYGWITDFCSLFLTLAMLLLGGFAWLDAVVRTITTNELLVSLLFYGFLFVANDILSIPFQLYTTFVIEQRFDFNRVTPKLFLFDKLKTWGALLLIGGGVLTVIVLIYSKIPDYFWLVAWAFVAVFMIFINLFYSQLIVPLFNKQQPLEEGALREAIEEFAVQAQFELKNVYVIDGSKRSTKANAYFTGWGHKKRIVLYDTLIQQLTIDEIVAVLAHEIGHNKHRHTLKNMLIALVSNLLMFILLGFVLKLDIFAQALGCEHSSFHINMLVFALLYSPISSLLDLATNILSRRFEYQADAYVATFGKGELLISALKKISSQALSNLMPHPLTVFVDYSHPTLYQRIMAIKQVPSAIKNCSNI